MIAESGTDQFERHILVFCKTRGDASKTEERLLWQYNVLENNNFFNESIGNHKKTADHIAAARRWNEQTSTLLP
jgi:hypothetical protein